MDYIIKDKKLVLYFVGEINSINAPNVETDINETLKEKEFNALDLDFAKLKYISSAGLRIILKLKQIFIKI